LNSDFFIIIVHSNVYFCFLFRLDLPNRYLILVISLPSLTHEFERAARNYLMAVLGKPEDEIPKMQLLLGRIGRKLGIRELQVMAMMRKRSAIMRSFSSLARLWSFFFWESSLCCGFVG
jgi:hypothetical protein